VACEIVHKIERMGNVVGTLVMDEDCTTIARVRGEVSHDVVKWSDLMHIRKHLTGSLYKIQKKHRVLNSEVIKYIARCFSYALLQNKGDVDKVRAAVLNIVPHIFGEHANCGTWCKYSIESTRYMHRTLPCGRDLTGRTLRDDLGTIFTELANNADKIAPCATTRENESFNNMVASTAPKARHYSSSSSLETRMECAVACCSEEYRPRISE